MKVRSTLLALAAVAAATLMTGIAVSPAVAGETVAVPYGDLDLASAAGRARLDSRVFRAATMICGRYDPRELRLSALSRACRDDAIAGVRGQREAALGGGALHADVSVSQAAF
jgi:UrcA family protein